jgi:hypothetical protein
MLCPSESHGLVRSSPRANLLPVKIPCSFWYILVGSNLMSFHFPTPRNFTTYWTARVTLAIAITVLRCVCCSTPQRRPLHTTTIKTISYTCPLCIHTQSTVLLQRLVCLLLLYNIVEKRQSHLSFEPCSRKKRFLSWTGNSD